MIDIVRIKIKNSWIIFERETRKYINPIVEYQARDATALANGNGYDSNATIDINIRNAIAHTHYSANLAFSYGDETAKLLGDFKEWADIFNEPVDEYRDQFNNEVGRRMSDYAKVNGLSKDAFDDMVIDAINNHQIITDLSDPRIFNHQTPTWTNPSADWHGASAGRNYDGLPGGIQDGIVIPELNNLLNILPSWLKTAFDAYTGTLPAPSSPLVLDLNGNGFEVSKLGFGEGASHVYFDVDNDGYAERTAWVTGGDGLLALDRNGNGVIDNQGELFGNGQAFRDGFAALKNLDSNGDNLITAADAQFANLRVWVDANGDGISQASELKTLSSLGITSISLAATPQTGVLVNDNPVTAVSTFVMNGQTRGVGDVWFRFDPADTHYTGSYNLDPRTLFLPTLKGFGNIPDLQVAMSKDSTLLNMVQTFAGNWSTAKLPNPAALDADVQAILFKWAGVDGAVAGSRGPYIDARILDFVEKLTGVVYGQPTFAGYTPPGSVTNASIAARIMDSWHMAFDALKAQLIIQSGGSTLFNMNDAPVYDLAAGDLHGGTLSTSAIAALGTQAAGLADTAAKMNFWHEVATVLIHAKDVDSFTAAETSALNGAIGASGVSGTWGAIAASVIESTVLAHYEGVTLEGTDNADQLSGTTGDDNLNGSGGDDVLHGGYGADSMYGGIGNDNLDGGAGNDYLSGDAGNDTLNGGTGTDILLGGTGNDTYIFRPGDSSATSAGEKLYDAIGDVDTIKFTGGILSSDIRMWSDVFGQLNIQYTPSDMIVSVGMEQIGSTTYFRPSSIDLITFDNGTVWDLRAGLPMTDTDAAHEIYGSIGNDTIDGRGGDDYIDAKAGNDTVLGGTGNDSLYGGDGNDVISGQAGNDTLEGNAGDDTLTGGTGIDTVSGGAGNDIYVYSKGDSPAASGGETIYEDINGGIDTIRLTGGILPGDVRTWVDVSGRLNIQYSATDLLVSVGTHTVGTTMYFDPSAIEKIVFDNGTVWDLHAGFPMTDTDAAHQIYGSAVNDTIDGRGGDDYIDAGAGNDTVLGGDGNDTIYGGIGNDTLQGGAGNDQIQGGDGDDTIDGGAGDDKLYGQNGIDTLSYASATAGVTVNLAVTTAQVTGGAGKDTISGFENILGSAFNDKLTGDANANVIEGGKGNDILNGGAGADTATYAHAASAVTVNLATTSAQNTGGAGTDTLSNFENLTGSAFNDKLTGNAAVNVIHGGAGKDTLTGGGGADTLYGDGGADIFVFKAAALPAIVKVADFKTGEGDKLDLRDLLTGYDPVHQAITDFVRFTTNGANTMIAVDADGKAAAHGFVNVATLTGITGLDAHVLDLVASGNLLVH